MEQGPCRGLHLRGLSPIRRQRRSCGKAEICLRAEQGTKPFSALREGEEIPPSRGHFAQLSNRRSDTSPVIALYRVACRQFGGEQEVVQKCTKVTFGSEEGTTPSSKRRTERRSLAESSLAQFGISFSRMLRLHEFSGLDKRRRSHSAECRLTLSSFLRPLMLQFALRYLAPRESPCERGKWPRARVALRNALAPFCPFRRVIPSRAFSANITSRLVCEL
jgi:hypothetical protein